MTGSSTRPAAHDVALFEDRLIFNARPPITEAEIAEVEKRVGRPIPDGLLALWRTAFGGNVGYDLAVEFGGHVASFSFTELFYPGSQGYHDLWGWIDNEFAAAEDAGDQQAARGMLRFLPFGGFEYLDRLYVRLESGPDHGAVYAWMRGLPEAWALRLHEDSLARIADDVPSLFRMLALEIDPFAAQPGDYAAGAEMAEAVDEVRAADAAMADDLEARVKAAVLDWRAALADGSIAGNARLRRLALQQAAADGDMALVDQLARAGVDITERYAGEGNLLDHMLARGHDAAADPLIERGLDTSNAVRASASSISAPRVAQLLALGAEVDPVCARSAALSGHLDASRLMVDALAKAGEDMSDLAADFTRLANDAEASAARIAQGKMGSNRTPEEYRAQAEGLREMATYVNGVKNASEGSKSLWSRILGDWKP
ncbi:SMI1/KNR4 family protein [Xanthobacteraceae bacterium A53D]